MVSTGLKILYSFLYRDYIHLSNFNMKLESRTNRTKYKLLREAVYGNRIECHNKMILYNMTRELKFFRTFDLSEFNIHPFRVFHRHQCSLRCDLQLTRWCSISISWEQIRSVHNLAPVQMAGLGVQTRNLCFNKLFEWFWQLNKAWEPLAWVRYISNAAQIRGLERTIHFFSVSGEDWLRITVDGHRVKK
jgi:hypothetical protein